ncbi:MAG: hypothetical protein L0H94_11220, partial [Nitrospira sp.]|nr:hypothetical protein [Nitrospira sp.]
MRDSWILTKLFSCLILCLLLVCGHDQIDASAAQSPSSSPLREGTGLQPDTKEVAPSDQPKRPVSGGRRSIVAFGNSLTAGLGVPPDQSYPAHLQRKLDATGYAYRVVNAG